MILGAANDFEAAKDLASRLSGEDPFPRIGRAYNRASVTNQNLRTLREAWAALDGSDDLPADLVTTNRRNPSRGIARLAAQRRALDDLILEVATEHPALYGMQSTQPRGPAVSPASAALKKMVLSAGPVLKPILFNAIQDAIVGNDEVPFIKALVPKLDSSLSLSLSRHGFSIKTRSAVLHAKPKVDYKDVTGRSVRCELADLLFVVKYMHGSSYESRSVLYQAKCCRRTTNTTCDIDQIQLELLRDWPKFEFGHAAPGRPHSFTMSPTTKELGSYLLMQRRPALGGVLVPHGSSYCYGWIAPADTVNTVGPVHVDCAAITSNGCSDQMLFEQLAFSYGEPDGDPTLKSLLDALYRYVGLAADPPEEFDDYFEEDGAFGVIECQVREGG